jgi:hypothetical protein
MALYLLSYDITEKNHNYQSLWNFLDNAHAKHILYSEWAVPWANDASALDLTNAAAAHIEKSDSLFVCEIFDNTPTCAWLKLRISSEDFLALLTTYARATR